MCKNLLNSSREYFLSCELAKSVQVRACPRLRVAKQANRQGVEVASQARAGLVGKAGQGRARVAGLVYRCIQGRGRLLIVLHYLCYNKEIVYRQGSVFGYGYNESSVPIGQVRVIILPPDKVPGVEERDAPSGQVEVPEGD